MSSKTRFALVVIALALMAFHPRPSSAFVSNGFSWPQVPVPYYVNPTNLDGLPTAAVEAAVKAGADTWQIQSGAAVGLTYSGESSQTTNTFDSINLVLFRNASSGSAIATTYTWMMGSSIVDADIVFWDSGFTFFTGSTGCSNGFYIEDIAAHEFGHALGLGHSTTPAATMYPSTGSCNTSLRLLDADDIAGIRSLYPPVMTVPPAPAVLRVIQYPVTEGPSSPSDRSRLASARHWVHVGPTSRGILRRNPSQSRCSPSPLDILKEMANTPLECQKKCSRAPSI
jgi:hypothetical protein